jgi:phage/plasmid-like protein (TIGR03299 family)
MSANIESMFYVGSTPWHGLGEAIPEDKRLTISEGIEASGLGWDVGLMPLAISQKEVEGENQVGKGVSHRAVVRSDNKTVLGVVGPNYQPLQNKKAFGWFEPFLEAKEAELHTAGSLGNGGKVWVLAKLNREPMEIAKDDFVEKFVLLSNSHDGTTSVRVGFTPIRVVCANTLAAAHNNKCSSMIRIRHSRNVENNLESIREIMNTANASFEATAEQYKFLASKQINSKDLDKYVRVCLGIDEDDKISTRSKNTLENVVRRFEVPIYGQGVLNLTGTYWNAYNAVNEFLNYERGRNNDSRLRSLWFGDSGNMNLKALDKAVTMATV